MEKPLLGQHFGIDMLKIPAKSLHNKSWKEQCNWLEDAGYNNY